MVWFGVLLSATAIAAAEPRTADGVIAADHAWERAELAGDGTYLEAMLLPGYMSVNSDGSIRSKTALIGEARARDAAGRARLAALVVQWKATHPVRADVTLEGNMAILRWVHPGDKPLVSSCDIFVYRAGRWHAAYSQHSKLSD